MRASGHGAIASATALAEGLKRRGLGQVVTSPGSRNAPLIQAFSANGLLGPVALDERAAAHHALGMALALDAPVAACCTSGTAALNHGPALAEAFRSGLPLISITADRPQGAHGEWQSQTLKQEGIHALHVRAQFTWEPTTPEAAEALLDAMSKALRDGPIHINCPFDEPLYPDLDAALDMNPRPDPAGPPPVEAEIPASAERDALASWERLLVEAVERKDRIMLLGGTQPHRLSAEVLRAWSQAALLIGDTTSGMALPDVPLISACDRWLGAWSTSGLDWQDFRPDLIVTFGTPLLSRRLRAQLAEGARAHVHLDAGGEAPLAFGIPCRNISLSPTSALEAATGILGQDGGEAPPLHAWRQHWWSIETAVRERHDQALAAAPWSDLSAHDILHAAVPEEWDLHLGNSTPVRYAQLFPGKQGRHPWSNRGVAGIDGCSSTAVGAALAGRKTALITGELGFLYDANAFHIQPLPSTLRIAVIHNGGGGIFRWLDGPERTGLSASHFEWRHATALAPLCELHGLIHERVTDARGLRNALEGWWAPSAVPKVLEIATPSEESTEAYRAYMQAVRP